MVLDMRTTEKLFGVLRKVLEAKRKGQKKLVNDLLNLSYNDLNI
jgi:hypothetical protein